LLAHLILIVAALAFGAILFSWFHRLARAQRHSTIVTFILGLIVLETGLYETIDVPNGIFHPSTGALKFETVDFIILVAVFATLAAGAGVRVLSKTSLLWLAFGAWVASEAVVGYLSGNPRSSIAYEVKILLYLALFTVASRIPLRDPRSQRSFARFLYFSAAMAGITVFLGMIQHRVNLNFPGLRGAQLGQVGSIGANLYIALGVLGLCMAVCSERKRFPLLFVIAPLFVPPLMAHQRAALVTLSVSVVALAVLLPLARHKLRVTLAEGLLVVFATIALVALPVFINGVIAGKRVIPFSRQLTFALAGGEKKLTAQDRVNQIQAAKPLISQRPVTGWGLGRTIVYYEVGFKVFVVTYLTHNIVIDLLLRTGAVGLALFLLAVLGSLAQGFTAWRHASDPMVAATALASVTIVAGWVAHGLVESLFEHVQLAPLLGITLGLAQAAASQLRETAEVHETEYEGTLRVLPNVALSS
jgi:O-antigen ligase